jgi:hypothetical protein
MNINRRTKIAAGVAAFGAVAAGGAYAADEVLSPNEESTAIVNDVAEELGVAPSELTDAIEKALANRIDAAVQAGRITEAQAAELKERVEAGELPLFGLPHGRMHHRVFGGLDAAASYLGVTEAELREALRDGQTLADVAAVEGKSADGLVDALVADATDRLSEAVEEGRLTEAQKQEMLDSLQERMTDLVNGEVPRFGHRFHGPRFGDAA